jgi:hypothetical protein
MKGVKSVKRAQFDGLVFDLARAEKGGPGGK